MLSKRLLGIVLACALLLCGCMTGEGPVENKPVLDTPDARAAFTREAMMFTEMLFAGLPCEGTVTENGVQYPVVAHEQYPTYQSLVDALNWYFDPALAGALKEAMPYAEVQGKPVKTRDTATAGAQFDKSTVTADSAEGLTLTVPSSQGDLTVSITLKDGRISGYTGAGHPGNTSSAVLSAGEAAEVCNTLLQGSSELLNFLHGREGEYTENGRLPAGSTVVVDGVKHTLLKEYSPVSVYSKRNIHTLADVRAALGKFYTPTCAGSLKISASLGETEEPYIIEYDGKLYYIGVTHAVWFVCDGSTLEIQEVTENKITAAVRYFSVTDNEYGESPLELTVEKTADGWRLATNMEGYGWASNNPSVTIATGTYNGQKITVTKRVTALNCSDDPLYWPNYFFNGYASFGYCGKVGEENKYIGHTFMDKTGKIYTEPKYHIMWSFNDDGYMLAGIALDRPDEPASAKEYAYYLLDTAGNATPYTGDTSKYIHHFYPSNPPLGNGYTIEAKEDENAGHYVRFYISNAQGEAVYTFDSNVCEVYSASENTVVCWMSKGSSDSITACMRDVTGKQISPVVTHIGNFEDGLAPFVQDGKLGVIADTGEIVVPPTLPLYAQFTRIGGYIYSLNMHDGLFFSEEDGRLVIVEITRQFADMQGTALTAAQKEEIQQFLNATENNGFIVGNYYSYPEKISLYRAFRDGAGVGTFGATDWSEQEKQDVLAATGWPEYRNPPLKITASAVKQVLQEKLGLTQDQIQDDLSEHFRYVKAYDAYYTMHGDTEFVRVTVTGGRVDSDNVYVVAYTYGTDSEYKAVVTLRKTATGYQFISNVEDDREQTNLLTATGTYNGQKITMTMTVTDLNYPIDPYDWPRYFVNGYAPFAYYGKVGEENKYIGHTFIDKTGKVYTEPKYHVMSYFNEDGVASACIALDHPDDPSMATKYEYYLLDTAGNATPCASEPEDILWHGSPGTRSLGNGYALRNEADENAVVGTKYYIADSLGNVVYTFESHTLEVQAAGENAVVCWVGDDSSGKVVACMRDVTGKQISSVVDHIGTFKDGLAAFAQDGKVGLIADTGEIVIPATFPLTAQFTVAGVTRSLIMGLNGMMFAEHDGRVAIVEITRE